MYLEQSEDKVLKNKEYLIELLARGYLRLLLLKNAERKQLNCLKSLDKPAIARDELDK